MELDLGTLEKSDVREIWPNEANHFTPWLAKDENIALLGEAIGIELEVENTEVAVGPYSADILAKDTATDDYVVIENQLGKTDHDHLGKSITYASVLNANSIVWIASQFTEEHQKALEWLNDITSDEIGFFAIQLEIWKIDSSKPAVKFDVISRPAFLKRETVKSGSTSQLTPVRKLQLEFWTEFRNRLYEAKIFPSLQTPKPQYWYNMALGKAGINLSCIADTWGKKIGIRVVMISKIGDEALDQLLAQKQEIESQIGHELIWSPNPDSKEKIIDLHKMGDINDKDNWEDLLSWLVDMARRFRETFAPRVRALDL